MIIINIITLLPMKIVVCLSVVPDTTSKINFIENNTKLEESGITYIINPFDEFCLTKAIFIKEKTGADITVLNVGASKNDPILRKALAIGADRACLLYTSPSPRDRQKTRMPSSA